MATIEHSSNLPATLSATLPIASSAPLSAGELAALQVTQEMPLLLVSLLERRYLAEFAPGAWHMAAREGDNARPLLREVTHLGRPAQSDEWARAMPHVLAACHEPGHALIMALHGEGDRHRLYLGG